jgi:dynein heavy chain, axonemal
MKTLKLTFNNLDLNENLEKDNETLDEISK